MDPSQGASILIFDTTLTCWHFSRSPSNTHTTTSSHKKIGIIVGTILGGCLLIAAILVLIFYWKRRTQTPQAPIRDISPFHQDESTVRETNLNSTHLGSPPITTVLPSQTTPSTVPAISSTFADIQSNQSPSSSSPNHVQGHQTSHTAYASTPSQRIRAKRGANLQHASLPEAPPQYTPNDPEQ